MDGATLFQSVARISSPQAPQITSCLLQSCSRQDTNSIFALAQTLTPLMVVTCTRQRVNSLPSYSQAFYGGFRCGAHPHDVRVLPVSLLIKIHSLRFLISLKISLAHALRANHLKCRLSSCLLQNKYACAMIETGTRHTIPICACTKPEGRGYPAKLSSLLAHFKCETCAVTLGARTYYASKCVQDKGYHTKRRQESEVILTSTTTNTLAL